jgi:Mg2+/Co2+ transporter CorC
LSEYIENVSRQESASSDEMQIVYFGDVTQRLGTVPKTNDTFSVHNLTRSVFIADSHLLDLAVVDSIQFLHAKRTAF